MVKKLIKKLSSKVLGRGKKASSTASSKAGKGEPKSGPKSSSPSKARGDQDPRPSGGRSRRRRGKRGGRDRGKPGEAREGGRRQERRPTRAQPEEWRPGEGRKRASQEQEQSDRRERPAEERKPSDGRKPRRRRGRRRRTGERPAPKQQEKPEERREEKRRPPRKPWLRDEFRVAPKDGETRFHDFDLPDEVMHAVYDLGFEYCTPIQGKVLGYATQRKNIAGRAQTGTGKTAAFLICIYSRFLKEKRTRRSPGTPRALILAPTRELVMQIAKDAEDLGKHCDFRCLAVYGGIDFEKQRNELRNNQIDLIAATPGRLIDFKGRGVLDLKQLEVLVIDEADRMLDMGFIPDVKKIIRATPPKDKRQTMLFSATLTEDVLRLASQWMPDPVICEVDPEQVTVDTVKQVVYAVTARDKFRLLYNLLEKEKMERVLLFGNRRDTTQRLSDNLRRHGIECEYLSGAVRQDKRQKVLEGFRAGKIRIVVATDVAGRGLHVDNISHVINYEFPYEPEDYVHRIGRTGRAGVAGTAVSFACEDESFVIPEIEEYIGQPLKCTVPEPELLEPIPPPSRPPRPARSERSGPPRRGGRRPRSRGGSRPRGGGSRPRR